MEIRIILVSNIIFEPYFRTYITKAFSTSASNIQLTSIPYEELAEKQDELRRADVVVVCMNFDELYLNVLTDVASKKVSIDDIFFNSIERCKELYSSIKNFSNAKLIWLGFEDYYLNHDIVCGTVSVLNGVVDRINQIISDILVDDVYIDLKRLIAKVGINSSYSSKGKYRWIVPYSKEFIALMADEVYKQYLIHTGKTKKCIVLDCDNVLWGGILSEDGIEGIHLGSSGLGREYRDFQRFLLNLYYHGIILTVCSKNDEVDVLRVFREHSGMLLREGHVACFKINWNDKPGNIKAIADELNIGTDSMVFVDDSLLELEAVKSVLPDVTTIRYDRETMYNDFSCFNLKSEVNLADVEKRNETYRTNQRREKLKKNCSSYEDYIKSLDIKVDIHKILPTEYSRVAELTQRTNKCTNGKRYTVSEIKKRMTIPEIHFYSVSLSDRFSDLGIVGAIEVETNELKLFNLSCRALGRGVENEMINYISNRHELENVAFKLTEKNESLLELMQQAFPNSSIIDL